MDRFASFQRRAIKTLDLSHNCFNEAGIARLEAWISEAGNELQTLRLR